MSAVTTVRTRRPRLTAAVSLTVAVLFSVQAVAPPAWGSTGSAPPNGDRGESSNALRVLSTQFEPEPYSKNDARSLWIWQAGNRAYEMKGDPGSNAAHQSRIVSYDLDSLQRIGDALVPRTPSQSRAFYGHALRPETVAIDEATGRLFVPASSGALTADPHGGSACVSYHYATNFGACMTHISVVDGTTLETVESIPLRALNLESQAPAPSYWPMALTVAPPRRAGDRAKLLVLAMDSTTADNNGGGSPPPFPPHRVPLNAYAYFLIQIDLATLSPEWSVRVEACRGWRAVGGEASTATKAAALPHAAALFRLDDVEDPAIVVACHTGSTQGSAFTRIPLDERGVPTSLPVVVDTAVPPVVAGLSAPREQASPPVAPAEPVRTTFGPDRVFRFIADAAAERVAVLVLDGNAGVWWIFDAASWRLIGTIGVGYIPETAIGGNMSALESLQAGLDPNTGRLYTFTKPLPLQGDPGGMFVADIRRDPLPQALHFPYLAQLWKGNRSTAIPVRTASNDRKAWLMLIEDDLPSAYGLSMNPVRYHLIEDLMATYVAPETSAEPHAGRTLDIDEAPGLSEATLDGTARGYGARVLLVGGIEAAGRFGPVDPLGATGPLEHPVLNGSGLGPLIGRDKTWNGFGPPGSPCTSGNREVVLGMVGPEGPAVVDASGARGGAAPVVADSATTADGEAPISRCGAVSNRSGDWQSLWRVGLFGQPPISEPSAEWPFHESAVQCISTGDSPSAAHGDPVTGMYAAKVGCADEEASGYAYARTASVMDTDIAEALSSFRIYRDPTRGIVARVESVARGIHMPGVVRIDTVRGIAESWANGRRFFPPEPDENQQYDPNCDLQRTAGTCLRRQVFGVWTPGYSCGPCSDEVTVVERVGRSLGQYGEIRFREPDAELARGAGNGFTAAITKPDHERFADLALNNDLLQTVVPTLEIIRYAPPNKPVVGGGTRGRQIYQFAGVEVSSSYGIQCLLVYDEATNTCGAAPEDLGSLTITLADPDGEPLAGGAFEVRRDSDEDGALGLVDELLPEGACVTADDGTGTCSYENLQPGGYLVSQTAAPPGYSKVAEPWVSEVAPGEARTVTFTNASNVSVIEVSATDEAGNPLEGAQFAVFPDADADGKVAPETQPAATCTTDAAGTCSMRVPVGNWVLVQTAAPGGLAPIEPVAFALTSGGQTAAVGIVNYPAQEPTTPVPGPAPVYSDPPAVSAPTEAVTGFEQAPPVTDERATDLPQVAGDTITRVIRAPGDIVRLLSRDPRQAVAWTAAIMLFALALAAVHRRSLLASLAVAPGWGGGPPSAPPGPRPPRPRGPSRGPSSGGMPNTHPGGDPAVGTRGGPVGGGGATARQSASARAGGTTAVLDRLPAVPVPGTQPVTGVVAVTSSPSLLALIREQLTDLAIVDAVRVCSTWEEFGARSASPGGEVLIIDLSLVPPRAEAPYAALRRAASAHRIVGIAPAGPASRMYVTRAYEYGLDAILVEPDDVTNAHLAYAIRSVTLGRRWYSATAQAMLFDELVTGASAGLTPRELEVARLAAGGMRRKEIAEHLYLSPFTIKRHLTRIRTKLGIEDPRDQERFRERLLQMGIVSDDRDADED